MMTVRLHATITCIKFCHMNNNNNTNVHCSKMLYCILCFIVGTVSFVSSKYMEEEGRVVDIIIQLTRVAFNVNITVLLTTEELTATGIVLLMIPVVNNYYLFCFDTASSDFDEISRIITFTPDIDEVIVPLNLLEDSILESTESLLVQLQVPNEASGTVLRIDKAVIDILDNDSKI